MEIAFWALTDIGRVRDHNEDNFLVDKRLRLFVVCDGMGGHAAGEVASAMSVRVVREVISEKREIIERVNETPEDPELRREILNQLELSIQEANRRVFEAAREDQSRHGMGTTCVVLLLTNKKAFIAHVGDSRVYLVRNQQIHQLTEDHSLYNEMVRLGKIRPGEQLNLPNKNAVTRAVGVRETVDVDSLEIDILEHDRFLACSDGLCGYFKTEEQIRMVLGGEDVKSVTELCIAFALDCGGKDNVTAIVIDVVKQEDGSRHTQEVELTMELLKTIPYFQYLGYKERVQVMNLAHVEQVKAGVDVLSHVGDPAAFLVVLQGELEMRRMGEPPMRLGTGSFAGEVGFIDGQPHDFEVFAKASSILLVFERKQFMELLRRDPELAVKLLWNFLQMFTIKVRELSLPMAELTMFPLDDDAHRRDEDLITTNAFDLLADPMEAESFPGALPLDAPAQDSPQPVPAEPEPVATVEVAPAPQAPVKIMIPGADDEPPSLSETTETPEDLEARIAEDDQEPEEDLRATVQLDWGSSPPSLTDLDRQGFGGRPSSAPTPAPVVPHTPPAMPQAATTSQPGPPPLPSAAAAPASLKPPSLPSPAGKLPPLPQRPKKTPPPLGRGISGESITQGQPSTDEEATQARVEALSPSLIEEPVAEAPASAPATPFSIFDEVSAPTETATSQDNEQDGAKVPPRAAVMKRGQRRRSFGESSLAEDSLPLGMREPKPGAGDEGEDRPPELVATIQLNLNDIHPHELADEQPTKQLQRPSADDFAALSQPEKPKNSAPSSKVQVNFSLDDN